MSVLASLFDSDLHRHRIYTASFHALRLIGLRLPHAIIDGLPPTRELRNTYDQHFIRGNKS